MTKLNFFFLLFLFVSCGSSPEEANKEKYAKELEQIEKWRVQLDDAEEIFATVDTVKAVEAARAYDRNTRIIGENYVAEKIDTSIARMMNSYKVLKGGKGINASRDRILKELTFTKNNLNALEENIIAGKFSDEEIEKYVQDEKEAITRLCGLIKTSSNAANRAAQAYDSLNPLVEDFVEEILEEKDTSSTE